MNVITNALYWLSTGLLVPVVVLLLILFVRALLIAGGFYGLYVSRRREEQRIKAKMGSLTYDTLAYFGNELAQLPRSTFAIYAQRIAEARSSEAHCRRYLAEFEIAADRELAKSKTLTKLGPILGLMGTLIPMGPALVGLSTGDIAAMAHNMQVAFATTVVGLAAGAIGYITQQVMQRWFLADYTNLEFMVNLIAQQKKSLVYET